MCVPQMAKHSSTCHVVGDSTKEKAITEIDDKGCPNADFVQLDTERTDDTAAEIRRGRGEGRDTETCIEGQGACVKRYL